MSIETKHYLEAFKPARTLAVVTQQPCEDLVARYPWLTMPDKLTKQAFRLSPLNREAAASVFLGKKPEENALSDYSLWRALQYRSYNPLRRISLHQNFVHDILKECEFDRASANLATALQQAQRRRRQVEKALDDNVDVFSEIVLDYIPHTKTILNTEVTKSIVICARDDCPIRRLAIGIFSLPQSYNDLPALLPRPQLFTSEGTEIVCDDDSWGYTLAEARSASAAYASFGGHLFRLRFLARRPASIRPEKGIFFYVRDQHQKMKCEACGMLMAAVEVSDCLLLPLSPSYLCGPCYRELLPENGDKTYGLVRLLPSDEPVVG